MNSMDRRSLIGLVAVALAAALFSAPAFAQDQSVEDIVRGAPAPSKPLWKPLVDLPDAAWSRFADAAHLRHGSKCGKNGAEKAAPCWSLTARYTVDRDDPASAERVEDDLSVRYGQRSHVFLFLKRLF
jgi:hypothetical protein